MDSLVNSTNICAVLSHSVMSDSLQPYALQPARLLCPWGFSRQKYWSGLPCPPPGDLPNPGIEPRFPALQEDSLLSEPPGKPKNIGVDSLSLLQRIFPTQELNQGLLQYRQILYQLSYQGSPEIVILSEMSEKNRHHMMSLIHRIKKKKGTNEPIYKRETQSQTQRTNVWLPKVGAGVIKWETGIDIYTLLYIKNR